LPKKAALVNLYAGRGVPTYGHSDETLTGYARANVAHATAPLQAEIEALRAEVERVTCELMDAITRADKLAEALREAYRQVRELCDCYGHVYPEASFVRYEALLRDQEEGK